ncbi:hypothetical protein [Limoniibacter endophyticus]|uniref:hypothetical protein n=1 Tax=Limoniibacter endophyticus TaxID=1565040 RepID=UPI001676F7BB|nr:hypothetical protein [Limoniibacter endophyticus]
MKLDTGQDLKLLLKKEGHKVAFALADLPVTRVDLNDGGSSDDLIISSSPWRGENHLYYKARFFSLSANLIDFGKKTYLRNYQDPDGVDGRAHNDIFNQFIDSDTIVLALESSVTDVPLS